MLMKWFAAIAMAGTMLLSPAAHAQDNYPSKIAKIVVGFPPGSSADILGRIYAQHLSEYFGQQFIIENKPGASSNIAVETVTRSTPDGYTLVIGSTANTISTHALKLQYDFAKDLAPIVAFADGPIILMVDAKLGVSNVKEFVAYAKQHPGKVTFGSSGTWSGPHMAGEQFSLATGANLSFVPYQGVPAAISDLLGGQINSVFATAPTAAGYANDSRVKLLAVASSERSSLIPNIPTLQEQGLKNADTSIWYGFFAPKGTPLAIRQKLADAVVKITQRQDVKEALKRNGCEPLSIELDALENHVVKDIQRWKGVTETVKAKMAR
jgi:tripartite-type tricarboxylate transporter receptor subunit TctC